MLERTNIDGNKVIVETVSFREKDYGFEGEVGRNDSSDEEDLTAATYYIQSNQPEKKKKTVAKPEEEKKAAGDKPPTTSEMPGIDNAEAKRQAELADDESSEEIDLEKPDTNIQDIIEEMKRRRRISDEKKTDKPASKAKAFEDFNPARVIQDHEDKPHHKWKLITLVSRGHCVVGAVFHVIAQDNAAEFDPYYIERIKTTLNLMVEKDLVR